MLYMDKKMNYIAPSIEVLWLAEQTSLLAASDGSDGEISEEVSLCGMDDYFE